GSSEGCFRSLQIHDVLCERWRVTGHTERHGTHSRLDQATRRKLRNFSAIYSQRDGAAEVELQLGAVEAEEYDVEGPNHGIAELLPVSFELNQAIRSGTGDDPISESGRHTD